MSPLRGHDMTEISWARFESLATTYGGDIGRWPVAEREPAKALTLADPIRAREILAAEAELDALLDGAPAAMVSDALRERVLASAPRLRGRTNGWTRWLTSTPILTGAAAAAACAGLMFGVLMTRDAVSAAHQEALSNIAPAETILSAETSEERTI
jgi:hypothetical protein